MEQIKYYILQQTDKNNCPVNIYYTNLKGKDNVCLGKPNEATKFNTFGEAMRESVRISKENKGIYFKVTPIYNDTNL